MSDKYGTYGAWTDLPKVQKAQKALIDELVKLLTPPKPRECVWCGKDILISNVLGTRTTRKHCGNSCRTAAYRDRKKRRAEAPQPTAAPDRATPECDEMMRPDREE